MARPGDVTLDKFDDTADIVADISQKGLSIPGAPYPEVLFERVPSIVLILDDTAANTYRALGQGGRLEILTSGGTSAPQTIDAIKQVWARSGFCGMAGAECGSGLVRMTATE